MCISTVASQYKVVLTWCILLFTTGCSTTSVEETSPYQQQMATAEASLFQQPMPLPQARQPLPESARQVLPVAYEEPVVSASPNRPELVMPPAPLAEDVSTLPKLEQLALNANPALSAANARIRVLQGKWLQVGLAPNPTVGYLGEEMGDDGTAGKQGGFVGQQFITGNKLGLNRAVVSQEIAQAEQEWAAMRQRVLTDVRTGYYGVLIAQRRIELTRDLVALSEQAVDAAKALVDAQQIARPGLLQAELELQNAQILAGRAVHEHEAAWRNLTSVAGQPNLPMQQLGGTLNEVEESLNWDVELNRIVSQSPELSAAIAEMERAQWSLERAFAENIPDVDIRVATMKNNLSGDDLAGVEVGLPIPLWNRNQGGIRQAQNEIVESQRNIERVELNLRRRLAIVFREYANARFEVEHYESEMLPKAKEAFDLISQGFKAGEVGYLDMLTAQKTYFQTNLAYLSALRDKWNSRLRIEGLLLEDSLASRSR